MSRSLAISALLLSGCGFSFQPDAGTPPVVDTATPAAGPTGSYAAAARADLRVKRWRQLSLDLQGALELPEDQVCKEAGNFDCAVLHTAQLGGVSVDHALYEPITWWTVTTGLAMERFSLQACHNRLVLDRDGDAPVVYTHVELGATTLTAEAADAQATELWRRVLARDPAAWELEAARELHADVVADGANNGEWAALLCFSLATSTEHLLY